VNDSLQAFPLVISRLRQLQREALKAGMVLRAVELARLAKALEKEHASEVQTKLDRF